MNFSHRSFSNINANKSLTRLGHKSNTAGTNGHHRDLASREQLSKTSPRPIRTDGRSYVAHIPMRLLHQVMTSDVRKPDSLSVNISNEYATITADDVGFQCDKPSSLQLAKAISGHVLRLVAMQQLDEAASFWYERNWVPEPWAALKGVNIKIKEKIFTEFLMQCRRRRKKNPPKLELLQERDIRTGIILRSYFMKYHTTVAL